MENDKLTITLKVWRQKDSEDSGRFETYKAENIDLDMTFFDMMDIVNEGLIAQGSDPIAFDHDCREGTCGSCGAMVNGQAHGPVKGVSLCQLHMRHFKNKETVLVEPWRSKAFPVIKDLVVDRSALDRLIMAGGYISVEAGEAPEANTFAVSKETVDLAYDAASCIGCGACVAACPNASAMLFVASKISHLCLLPQGEEGASQRIKNMIEQMDQEELGYCSNNYQCEAACPKQISAAHIARLNKQFFKAHFEE